MSHAACEVRKHLINCDSHTSNTGFASAFSGFQSYNFRVIHRAILSQIALPHNPPSGRQLTYVASDSPRAFSRRPIVKRPPCSEPFERALVQPPCWSTSVMDSPFTVVFLSDMVAVKSDFKRRFAHKSEMSYSIVRELNLAAGRVSPSAPSWLMKRTNLMCGQLNSSYSV